MMVTTADSKPTRTDDRKAQAHKTLLSVILFLCTRTSFEMSKLGGGGGKTLKNVRIFGSRAARHYTERRINYV